MHQPATLPVVNAVVLEGCHQRQQHALIRLLQRVCRQAVAITPIAVTAAAAAAAAKQRERNCRQGLDCVHPCLCIPHLGNLLWHAGCRQRRQHRLPARLQQPAGQGAEGQRAAAPRCHVARLSQRRHKLLDQLRLRFGCRVRQVAARKLRQSCCGGGLNLRDGVPQVVLQLAIQARLLLAGQRQP